VYFVVTTITTVGFGDTLATSDGERVLAIATMLAGSVFLSFLIGALVETLANIGRTSHNAER
jgi:hypothetical protein